MKIHNLYNIEGKVIIDYHKTPADIYTAVAVANITQWTFSNFPTDKAFVINLMGDFTVAYNGGTAEQDGLKVFSVLNRTMAFENASNITKESLGLGNVDNTSDINKPVSTAQQAAIDINVNTQTGTTYTFQLTDKNKVVTGDNPATQIFTIPTNASVAFPVPVIFAVDQLGVGQISIQGDTGVTVNGILAGSIIILEQFLGVSIKQIATDEWVVQGGI